MTQSEEKNKFAEAISEEGQNTDLQGKDLGAQKAKRRQAS